MEPRSSPWSRDLVLADSLDLLRELTLQRLAPAAHTDNLVSGGQEKTSVRSRCAVSVKGAVADPGRADRH